MKAISHSPVNAPGVCLLPPQKLRDGISERNPSAFGDEGTTRPWDVALKRRGGRGGLPEHLPQVKTLRISKTK